MAGCDRRPSQSSLQMQFLLLISMFVCDFCSVPKFKDFVPNVLERHIKVSRHLPVCVIYRKAGEGSDLEDAVHQLWSGGTTNFTAWQLGSYAYGENSKLHYRKPSAVPLLRCFLGITSLHDYTGEPKIRKLNRWLHHLAKKVDDQLQDATEELVSSAVNTYKFTIIAFPDHTKHYEVEEMVFQVSDQNDNCKAYISHMHSLDNRKIREKYNINEIPSVVILLRKDSIKTVHVFSRQQMSLLAIYTFVKSRSMSIPHFSLMTFERDVMKTKLTSQTPYTPKIIIFYTYWSPGIHGYLSMFNRSVEEFRKLDLQLHFGLVDLNDNAADSRKIITRWISSRFAQRLPFTLLFYKDSNGTIQQLLMPDDRPSPLSIYSWLSSHDIVAKATNLPTEYLPYGKEDPLLFTHGNEGPYGTACYVTSHNQTDNSPQEYWWSWTIPRKTKKKKKETEKAWHDLFGTEGINKKLQKLDGIPLLTSHFWPDVIEKSHAPLHPFLPGKEWAGEVTKVALVIFIMADCRSCKHGMDTFKKLQNSVQYIVGGSVYLVNCTEEVELCREHDIRGYPTVTAFRGLGWLESSSCLSDESQNLYKSFTRMDYHGVLQAKPIMVWFGEVASSAVKDKMFDSPSEKLQEDVRLVAYLVPKGSRYLPIPPGRKQNYYFSYECYRLICERLYGKATCYSKYSSEIPQKEFKVNNLDVVVSKIVLQRLDGVETTVMQIGHTLSQSLENPFDLKLHMFHRAHRYKLLSNQKCEDDHSACTDIITAFTMDHSRLPITQINSNIFHTSDRFDTENLPILIALVYKDNVSDTSSFSQVLTQIAYQFYNEMIVMTLDVEEYPSWAGQFVPKDYKKIMLKYNSDPQVLFQYPRMCIVNKKDHNHAVFYPPLDEDRFSTDWFIPHRLQTFILDYFDDPSQYISPTEQF